MTTPSALPKPFIPLTSSEVTLAEVGGKALNLARLARAGHRVPDAFFIPTKVYREYVERNNLDALIAGAIQHVSPADSEGYQSASVAIRDAFLAAVNLPESWPALEIARRWLGAGPVAVRSSATAEDLPGFSFAGQQDTILNVATIEGLSAAIIRCWGSLWTARAISYRDRNQIGHSEVDICVIVQKMVESTASGVAFTADPVTGLRSETVIEATFGLGEALVSGKVEADRYVIDRREGAITSRILGDKGIALRAHPSGGLREETLEASNIQAIPDQVILELVDLGVEIQELFDFPQDIEWAYERGEDGQGRIFLLQSRPITSLYPLPADAPRESPRVMLSFGAVQGLLEPMTPLGWDAVRLIFAGGARLLGGEADYRASGAIHIAGHRLWVDLTGMIRNPLGARLAPRFLGVIEPGSSVAMAQVLTDERIGAGKGRLRLSTLVRVGAFLISWIWRVVRLTIRPGGMAAAIRAKYQRQVKVMAHQAQSKPPEKGGLDHALDLLKQLQEAFPYAVPEIASGAIAGLAPLFLLVSISRRLTGSNDLALKVTRGLRHNVTTEMDLQLWEIAQSIRADPASRARFQASEAAELAQAHLDGDLSGTASSAIESFLDRYGMRGPGEIDIGRPRWREDPIPVLQTVKGYLEIKVGESAPDRVFHRSQREALDAISEMEAAARGRVAGRMVAAVIRWAARRVRSLAGLREAPKFYIVQLMGIIRNQLQAAGAELARKEVIEGGDDIFFLRLHELEALAQGRAQDWARLVSERKEQRRREMLRSRIPRLMISDGRAFYAGLAPADGKVGELGGSPVSPGVVRGHVRIVLGPDGAALRPGEIMVCRGTDPAWTPLFLSAGGLIMEVGGMMTHGAIVAREYGIPAVVGVDQATERLKDGDQVEVDGSNGRILIL